MAPYRASAGGGPTAYYVPDPPLDKEMAEVLRAYPWLGEGVAAGLESLARSRPYTAMELTLSHIIAAAVCHAHASGRPEAVKGLLEAVAGRGSRRSGDDASVAVAFAALREEPG